MKPTVRTLALCALAALLAGAATATTVEPMSGTELTDAAELIVVGRCTDATTQWIDRALVTFVTIEVDDTWKGESTRQVTIAVPGGVDPEREIPIAVTFPGAPELLPGDELLLFLDPVAALAGTYSVVGFFQGLFPVQQDAEGRALVTQSRSSRVGAMPLSEVRQRIGAHLAKQKAGR